MTFTRTYLLIGFSFVNLIFLLCACGAKDSTQGLTENDSVIIPVDSMAFIFFPNPVQDLGKIVEGEQIKIVYRFMNQGGEELIINRVETSCGCTETSFTSEPVPVAGEGIITVVFDSKGFQGLQTKSMRVITNSRKTENLLAFTANIIPDNSITNN